MPPHGLAAQRMACCLPPAVTMPTLCIYRFCHLAPTALLPPCVPCNLLFAFTPATCHRCQHRLPRVSMPTLVGCWNCVTAGLSAVFVGLDNTWTSTTRTLPAATPHPAVCYDVPAPCIFAPLHAPFPSAFVTAAAVTNRHFTYPTPATTLPTTCHTTAGILPHSAWRVQHTLPRGMTATAVATTPFDRLVERTTHFPRLPTHYLHCARSPPRCAAADCAQL